MSNSSSHVTALGLCPEEELLLRLSRTRLDAAAAARAQTLMQGGIDWDALLRRALHHRVAPLLYPHLSALCAEAPPPVILATWRQHVEANAAHNLLLAKQLIRILELLRARDIPAVPFKGPVLAALVYGLGRRAWGDLDILVRRQDALRARDLLIAQGYVLKEPGGPWDASYLRYAYEASLVHPDESVCVDLHWGLTGNAFPFPLRLEHIWGRLQPVTLLGTTLHTLPADDLLLYLCVHGAKHLWRHLGWVCDVAELIRRQPDVVSTPLIARAQALGSERILALGLVLAQRLMDIRLPHAVSQQAQSDPRVFALADVMSRDLFDDAHATLDRADEVLLKFKMRERFRDRGRQALHWIAQMLRPNKRDRALLPLPAACAGLYYGFRPIRLIWTYGMKPLRRLLRIPGVLLKTLYS